VDQFLHGAAQRSRVHLIVSPNEDQAPRRLENGNRRMAKKPPASKAPAKSTKGSSTKGPLNKGFGARGAAMVKAKAAQPLNGALKGTKSKSAVAALKSMPARAKSTASPKASQSPSKSKSSQPATRSAPVISDKRSKSMTSVDKTAQRADSASAEVTTAIAIARHRVKRQAIDLPAGYKPSDREPFMSDLQREYFRRKLLAWKDDINRETQETLAVLNQESQQHADLADRASSETDRALELRARDRQRKLIAKIDAALGRISDGSYGYCEDTGEPIGIKRLDARPIATLSIEAQERHERRERVYRDE
jgi:DnaK suppressor protein